MKIDVFKWISSLVFIYQLASSYGFTRTVQWPEHYPKLHYPSYHIRPMLGPIKHPNSFNLQNHLSLSPTIYRQPPPLMPLQPSHSAVTNWMNPPAPFHWPLPPRRQRQPIHRIILPHATTGLGNLPPTRISNPAGRLSQSSMLTNGALLLGNGPQHVLHSSNRFPKTVWLYLITLTRRPQLHHPPHMVFGLRSHNMNQSIIINPTSPTILSHEKSIGNCSSSDDVTNAPQFPTTTAPPPSPPQEITPLTNYSEIYDDYENITEDYSDYTDVPTNDETTTNDLTESLLYQEDLSKPLHVQHSNDVAKEMKPKNDSAIGVHSKRSFNQTNLDDVQNLSTSIASSTERQNESDIIKEVLSLLAEKEMETTIKTADNSNSSTDLKLNRISNTFQDYTDGTLFPKITDGTMDFNITNETTVQPNITDETLTSNITAGTMIPNITYGTTPNISNGTTPTITDGTTPNITDGTTPNITDGSTPNITDGTTPNITDGTTPNITDGTLISIMTVETTTPITDGTISSNISNGTVGPNITDEETTSNDTNMPYSSTSDSSNSFTAMIDDGFVLMNISVVAPTNDSFNSSFNGGTPQRTKVAKGGNSNNNRKHIGLKMKSETVDESETFKDSLVSDTEGFPTTLRTADERDDQFQSYEHYDMQRETEDYDQSTDYEAWTDYPTDENLVIEEKAIASQPLDLDKNDEKSDEIAPDEEDELISAPLFDDNVLQPTLDENEWHSTTPKSVFQMDDEEYIDEDIVDDNEEDGWVKSHKLLQESVHTDHLDDDGHRSDDHLDDVTDDKDMNSTSTPGVDNDDQIEEDETSTTEFNYDGLFSDDKPDDADHYSHVSSDADEMANQPEPNENYSGDGAIITDDYLLSNSSLSTPSEATI